MKTRWMIKVESKIKEAPRGAPLLFWSLAPWCLLRTDWSEVWSERTNEVWTDSRYDWYFEFILIFWVHSTTQGASLDISLLLINTNQWTIDSLELQHHARKWLSPGSIRNTRTSPGCLLLSIYTNGLYIYERFGTPERVLDAFSYRYIRAVHIYTNDSELYTNDSEHLNESWMSSPIELTLESLVFNSRSYCYGANSCFDRSNNQSLHSLFNEHEPWNRNFPTNNIELKRQGGRVLFPVRLIEISRSAPLT